MPLKNRIMKQRYKRRSLADWQGSFFSSYVCGSVDLNQDNTILKEVSLCILQPICEIDVGISYFGKGGVVYICIYITKSFDYVSLFRGV